MIAETFTARVEQLRAEGATLRGAHRVAMAEERDRAERVADATYRAV